MSPVQAADLLADWGVSYVIAQSKLLPMPNSAVTSAVSQADNQIGRAGFHRLMAILAGADAPKETVLPSPIITKDNAVKFYSPDSVF